MITEFELIDKLKKKVPHRIPGGLGIGDDAAILGASGSNEIVVTTDTIVENIDFLIPQAKPEDIGRKALAVNLSDIAAMGGTPAAFVATLGISKKIMRNPRWIESIYRGMKPLAERYGVVCAGGDITQAEELFVSLTLIGYVKPKRAVTRAGAKPGDWIGVTGSLGGSLQGKHLDFEPRVREGQYLSEYFKPSAMIDVSDGLVQDLEHLLAASKVRAEVSIEKIPVSKAAMKAAKLKAKTALTSALGDGEDFELLFTHNDAQKNKLNKLWARKFPKVTLSWIGRIQKGRPRVTYFCEGEKVELDLELKGYDHFV